MLCILKSHHLFSWRILLYLHLTRQCFSSVQDKDWHIYTNTLQEWWMISKHSFVTPLSNYQLLLQSEGVNPVHGWAVFCNYNQNWRNYHHAALFLNKHWYNIFGLIFLVCFGFVAGAFCCSFFPTLQLWLLRKQTLQSQMCRHLSVLHTA